MKSGKSANDKMLWVRVPKELDQNARRVAERERRTISEVIRYALERYVLEQKSA